MGSIEWMINFGGKNSKTTDSKLTIFPHLFTLLQRRVNPTQLSICCHVTEPVFMYINFFLIFFFFFINIYYFSLSNDTFLHVCSHWLFTPGLLCWAIYTGWPRNNGTVDTVDFSGLCSNQQLFSSPCWIEHLFPIIITPRPSNLVENLLFYETFLMDCHFCDLPDFQSFEARWQINGKSQKWQSIRNYS